MSIPIIDITTDNNNIISWLSVFDGLCGAYIHNETPVNDFLINNLCIDVNYAMTDIQTLFLNNHPVDDPDTAMLKGGDVLALCAAMPGLVGIAMRKRSPVAAFRKDIAFCNSDEECLCGVVRVKLFNLVRYEIGPKLLSHGVDLFADEFIEFMTTKKDVLYNTVKSIYVDGQETTLEDVMLEIEDANMIQLAVEGE